MGLGTYAVIKPHNLVMDNCESHRCAQHPAGCLTAYTYHRSTSHRCAFFRLPKTSSAIEKTCS